MIETILKNLITENSNIWYGIGIGVIVVALLYGIIAFMNNNKKFTILSFAIGLVLLPFLSFQMSRLCGAIETRCTLDETIEIASSVKETISEVTGLSAQDSEDALSLASDFIPGVSGLVDAGTGLSKLSGVMLDKAYSYLNWYIVRRVLWSLGFIIIATLGICFTFEGGNTSGRRISLRYERVSSRREFERRPASRRTRR